MDAVLEALVVWLVASPVVAVLVGVAISRAAHAAEVHEERAARRAADLGLIPAQATASPEVVQLRLLPRG